MRNHKVYFHVVFDHFPKDPRVRRYCNALSSWGWKVEVVCLRKKGEPKREVFGPVTVHRYRVDKKRGSWGRRMFEYLLFEWYAMIAVTRLTLAHRPSIVHVHTLPDFLVFAAWLPKLTGAKIILDFHELFPEVMLQMRRSEDRESRVHNLMLFQEKISFSFANEIISFHEPAREILLSRGYRKKRITTIMNGIDEEEMPDFQKVETPGEFRIVYNGTINYNLNLTLLIEGLAKLREIAPAEAEKVGFYLYGEGPDLPNIMKRSAVLGVDRVYFKGFLPYKEMIGELQYASLCVLPPRKDLYSDLFYSLKLLEMIYLRIPVVATRLNTYQYFYPEGCIVYFTPDDVADLAEKILFVMRNPAEIEQYTANAVAAYRQYRWEIMKERYAGLIQSIS